MLTEKYKKIIVWCRDHNLSVTKKEAMQLINDHYCNGSKHVGETLSRMVKAGLLVRVKPGHFILGKGTRQSPATIIENQKELF